jgi:hypothetical protein
MYDLPEKIPRPYVQGTLVHNEGGDFTARLFQVIAGLTHPGFKVSNPDFRILAHIPY